MDLNMHPALGRYINGTVLPARETIPAERKEVLGRIAAFIMDRKAVNSTADLVFICTHNSRRSHLGQIWASIAAWHFGLDHVRTFSGGTEATAFNPRAVAALERAGVQVVRTEGANPVYSVSFTSIRGPERCWSKVYDDAVNPQRGFCAVMTCAEADGNCPVVSGALDRVSAPYLDPKEADGTPEESGRYDERCLQIAAEMWYVMEKVAG